MKDPNAEESTVSVVGHTWTNKLRQKKKKEKKGTNSPLKLVFLFEKKKKGFGLVSD